MRYLYALIVTTGLCAVPSLGQAATGADTASVSAVSAEKTARASDQSRADIKATAPQTAEADDRARYAERETQSGEAQNYRGGDTVVIGASAATAILAVLLLLVLI